MSEKKRSSRRGTAGTAGTAGACTQDFTPDQRLKCFRDIMDVVLHLSDEEWKAVTRDMKKKVTKLEFAALCTKMVTSAASSAIRRLLPPLIESFGIQSVLQAEDRKWSDSDASAQGSPREVCDFICQLVQRLVTEMKATMLEAIRRVASGRVSDEVKNTLSAERKRSHAVDGQAAGGKMFIVNEVPQAAEPDTAAVAGKILMIVLDVMEGCSSDIDDPKQISDLLMAADQRIRLITSRLRERSSETKAPVSSEELQMKASGAVRQVLLNTAGVRKSSGSSMELHCELQSTSSHIVETIFTDMETLSKSSESLHSAERTSDQLSGIFSATKRMYLTINKRVKEFFNVARKHSEKEETTTEELICSLSASSSAEDQISQLDDLTITCTNDICNEIITLNRSDEFDRPGGEKTSGTLLTSHQEVHEIMKSLEKVVSISRSSSKLAPDLVPVTTKVMAPDCASSASNAERLFSDQFLSKATQMVSTILLKTEEKIAASVSSQTSVPVRSETEIKSLMEEVETKASGIMQTFLRPLRELLSSARRNDADQSGHERKNFLADAQKIHKNIHKQVCGFVSERMQAISEKELDVRSENVQSSGAAEQMLDKTTQVASDILEKWLSSHISTDLFSGKDSSSSTASSQTASVDLARVSAEILNRVISEIADDMKNRPEAQASDADAHSVHKSKNFSDILPKLQRLFGLKDKKTRSCSSLQDATVTDAQSLVSVSKAPNLQADIDSCTEELMEKTTVLFVCDELLAKSSSSESLQSCTSDHQTCEVSTSVPLRSNEFLNKATQVVSEMLLRRLSTANSSRCSLEDVQSAISTAESLVCVLNDFNQSVKDEIKSSDELDAFSCLLDVREAESAKNPQNILGKVQSLLQAFFSKASRALSFPSHDDRVEEQVDLDLCTSRVITEVIDLLRSELTAPPRVKNDDAYFHSKSTRRVSDIIFRIVESCPLLPSQFPKERHTEARLRKVVSALNLQVVSTASEISQTVSSTVLQFIDADRKSRSSVQRSSFAPLHLFTVVRNQLKNFFTSFSKRVADDERTDASAQSERDEDRVTPIYISEDGTVHELTELEDLSPEEMIQQQAHECIYTFAEESIKALLQNVQNARPSAGTKAQESSLVDKSTSCPSATVLAWEIEDAGTSSVYRINSLHPKSPQLSAASSSSSSRADVEEIQEHLSVTDQQSRSGSDGRSSHPADEDQEKKRLGCHGRVIRRGVKKSKKKRSRVPLTGDEQPTPSTSANLHSSSHRESKASGSVFKNARRRLAKIFSNISKSFTGCFNSETAP